MSLLLRALVALGGFAWGVCLTCLIEWVVHAGSMQSMVALAAFVIATAIWLGAFVLWVVVRRPVLIDA